MQCPTGYYKSAGYCATTCSGVNFADNVTWSCTTMCSTGYWGYNFLCLTICPSTHYGYLSDRICYTNLTLPNSLVLFTDSITQTWVAVCPISPLRFGDRAIRTCIQFCSGLYFSDPASRQC